MRVRPSPTCSKVTTPSFLTSPSIVFQAILSSGCGAVI
jgi:hypothetical protein